MHTWAAAHRGFADAPRLVSGLVVLRVGGRRLREERSRHVAHAGRLESERRPCADPPLSTRQVHRHGCDQGRRQHAHAEQPVLVQPLSVQAKGSTKCMTPACKWRLALEVQHVFQKLVVTLFAANPLGVASGCSSVNFSRPEKSAEHASGRHVSTGLAGVA